MTPSSNKPGRRCLSCAHGRRPELDRALVLQTAPLAALARSYGLSVDALRNHREHHIAEGAKRDILFAAKCDRDSAVAESINGERVEIGDGLSRIVRELEAILNRAKARGDDPLALVSLKELRGTLLDLAKVYGSLKSELTVTVNLNDSPQWLQLREILLDVLGRHPQAKQEFIERARFLRLEHGQRAH